MGSSTKGELFCKRLVDAKMNRDGVMYIVQHYIAGGVGGVMGLIIVCQSLVIVVLLVRLRAKVNSHPRLVQTLNAVRHSQVKLIAISAALLLRMRVERWRHAVTQPMEW